MIDLLFIRNMFCINLIVFCINLLVPSDITKRKNRLQSDIAKRKNRLQGDIAKKKKDYKVISPNEKVDIYFKIRTASVI